jgi:hypothetical protein
MVAFSDVFRDGRCLQPCCCVPSSTPSRARQLLASRRYEVAAYAHVTAERATLELGTASCLAYVRVPEPGFTPGVPPFPCPCVCSAFLFHLLCTQWRSHKLHNYDRDHAVLRPIVCTRGGAKTLPLRHVGQTRVRPCWGSAGVAPYDRSFAHSTRNQRAHACLRISEAPARIYDTAGAVLVPRGLLCSSACSLLCIGW